MILGGVVTHNLYLFMFLALCQDEEQLQSSDHLGMFERSGLHFLEIRFVQTADAGIYTCLLTNSAGKASATAEVIVQGTSAF